MSTKCFISLHNTPTNQDKCFWFNFWSVKSLAWGNVKSFACGAGRRKSVCVCDIIRLMLYWPHLP